MIDLTGLTDDELTRLEALLNADPDPTLSAFDAKLRDAIERARLDHVHESRARRRTEDGTHRIMRPLGGGNYEQTGTCDCALGTDHA
jgi:hypothetical protein